MGNWNELLNEIKEAGSTYDVTRRKCLKKLHSVTGRNIVAYYSGWLQKPEAPQTEVNDADKNGFMSVIHKMDRRKGLDLMLHTPGGDTAATESLVDYLRAMFGPDIRAIVPQLAMSAGTMLACACKTIIMGKHSSLGPVDPQYGTIPAHGVVEEFKRAIQEVVESPAKAPIWQVIISKYHPTLIGECEKAIEWSRTMVKEWLVSGMLAGDERPNEMADNIVTELIDHALTLSHARHLSAKRCKDMGLNVAVLEDDPKLQDAVLTVHHSFIHTLSATSAAKIIENHMGVAYISHASGRIVAT